MSWLNNFLSEDENNNNNNNTNNTNNKNSFLPDKELALDMITSSKNDITMLSKAVAEAANPQLRQILTNQLNTSISEHFALSDMAMQKGWYNAFASPGQQIKQDMQEASQILQQQNK